MKTNIIERIHDLSGQGHSQAEICSILNKEGYKSPRSKTAIKLHTVQYYLNKTPKVKVSTEPDERKKVVALYGPADGVVKALGGLTWWG